jgi:hypothetical protein
MCPCAVTVVDELRQQRVAVFSALARQHIGRAQRFLPRHLAHNRPTHPAHGNVPACTTKRDSTPGGRDEQKLA